MNIISLGAGVQSTTLLLMAMHGQVEPMPDAAIFADTGWEPKAVYEHLAWLESVSTIPIHRVSGGNIREDALNGGGRFATMPVFVSGSGGMLRRQCTKEYKIRPIQKKVRELAGKRITTLWLGISVDEAIRMKESRVKYITHRYPLAMERRMTRQDCLRWLERHGYARPPRSACIGCPYRRNAEWRALAPDEFADAVAFDHAVRNALPRIRGQVFLHSSLQPLDMVDLRSEQERGQMDLWGNECEGMCGV